MIANSEKVRLSTTIVQRPQACEDRARVGVPQAAGTTFTRPADGAALRHLFVRPRAILASLAILAGLAPSAPVVRAQEGTDTRLVQPEPERATREKDRPLDFRIAFEYRHDDNIIQLNDHDQRRFRQDPESSRFRIDSIDDDIAVGRFDLRWRTRPIPRRVTSVALSADVYEYQRNDIKSYQEIGIALKQDLTASRRRLATIEASFVGTPRFYLRQITDDDASFAAMRRIRDELTYAQNEYG
ncbi:MAG: hypothetical protein ACREDF_04860, partial [Thermoplasmata archaeon]